MRVDGLGLRAGWCRLWRGLLVETLDCSQKSDEARKGRIIKPILSRPSSQSHLGTYQILARHLRLPMLQIRVGMLSQAYNQGLDECIYLRILVYLVI